MRAAIVGSYPLDRTRIEGGVQAAFTYLVGGLSQLADLDLHVVTIDYSASQPSQNVTPDGVTLHRLPRLRRFEFIRNYRRYQASLNQTLAHIQPDVVHAQDGSRDAYVSLHSGYPTVITVHGIRRENSKHAGNWIVRWRNQLHSIRIEGHNLRHTRHLIAISRYVTDYFSSILRPETKVYYIPNAINGRFFELEDTGNGHTVLFMGRVTQGKRPLDLVQAFAQVVQQIPQAQLRMAGECTSDTRCVASVRDFICHAGLSENVHLLGPLPEDRVLEEFSRCDLLALASLQETLPMVIAQAMAAGKPVVATNVGGVSEMVSDGETGLLVNVGDIESLAGAMHHLLQDPSLRTRMGQAGKRKAEADYHASSVAKQTFQVYQNIARGG